MALLQIFIISFFIFFTGCVSDDLRMPSSVSEVYSNSQMKQSLVSAAQNKILFHLPAETLSEVEKTEIDNRCRHFESPFWASKLSMYLNIFRSKPELFSKIHVIEIVKGDAAAVAIQKDMDKVTTLKIQYVKSESRGKVVRGTNLPCQGTLAEYIGRDLVKTEFEFPTIAEVQTALENASDKKDVARFDFSTEFLTYLAERGALFKFSHELSFEKMPNGKFVMAQLLNQYAAEVKTLNQNSINGSHLNLWLKKINENSKQAELIQFFGVESDDQLRTGIKVEAEKEISKKNSGAVDLTYMFTSYHVQADQLELASLHRLNQCLQKMTLEKGAGFFRRPASESEKDSYLSPGFICKE